MTSRGHEPERDKQRRSPTPAPHHDQPHQRERHDEERAEVVELVEYELPVRQEAFSKSNPVLSLVVS